jgi:hypothetical protein
VELEHREEIERRERWVGSGKSKVYVDGSAGEKQREREREREVTE